MDNEPTIVRVPSPPRRGTSAIVVGVAIVVALAILKPWSLGEPAGARVLLPASGPAGIVAPGSPAALRPSERPAPTPVAAVDLNAMACESSQGNRFLALVRSPGVEVRTWLTFDLAPPVDPLDPSVVPLRLASSHVVGLGICARRVVEDAALSSAAEILDVMTVAPGGAPRDFGAPMILTVANSDPTLGILYRPPVGLVAVPVGGARAGPSPSPAGSPGPPALPYWPVGEYAIEYRFPGDPPSLVRWLRLEIVPAVGLYD